MERRIEAEQDARRISTKTFLQLTKKQVNIVEFESRHSGYADNFAPQPANIVRPKC